MSGVKSGVETKIKWENPNALFMHCDVHALDLTVNDCIKMSLLNEVFTMAKVCNLF